MSQIDTWASRLANISLDEHAARRPSSSGSFDMPRPGIDMAAPPALAFVNHGRWLACCPDPDCHGAEYVDDRRPSFFCCECRNVTTDHVPIRLVIPTDRPTIETHLLVRTDHKTRNWIVGEPTAQLAAENVDLGHVPSDPPYGQLPSGKVA